MDSSLQDYLIFKAKIDSYLSLRHESKSIALLNNWRMLLNDELEQLKRRQILLLGNHTELLELGDTGADFLDWRDSMLNRYLATFFGLDTLSFTGIFISKDVRMSKHFLKYEEIDIRSFIISSAISTMDIMEW